MGKQRWKRTKQKLAKRLLPLFAPLVLTPMASPVRTGMALPDADVKKTKGRIAHYKVMKFNQLSYNLYSYMQLQDTGLNFEVFDKALAGYYNMRRKGEVSDKPVITIVDFAKASTQKRLWVIDVEKKELLYNTYVAHGRNSGENFAEQFSNKRDSYMSSIGFYVTEDTYYGKHGLSLKLNGLDEGFNTNAMDRCIVMHGAEYATEDFIEKTGRLGRSLGCPAVPTEEHEDIIRTVMGGTALYAHAPAENYTSQYLDYTTAMAELVKESRKELSPGAS
ncbi:L,D-transpeptidase-like protein [Pontibacter ummariensis]|uniref:L,D-transpeptidase catalytic domain n=1 Tax=Pontibacter ummariensis TaxID=1610492 RepID=A0A239INX8_9BACT|nr:murein L,D-transpeptidase catalytic domain family protein [Pontibacter ummariensis]PRY09723.1 L,D-transpeptidase-like protein [Pontibacter ummariensis]SNS95082.1 L,D-transpeptidase catalytic domain [Pontibacter ummariensis]